MDDRYICIDVKHRDSHSAVLGCGDRKFWRNVSGFQVSEVPLGNITWQVRNIVTPKKIYHYQPFLTIIIHILTIINHILTIINMF